MKQMSMNARLPGPGDESTWPACTGHPNDPRTPEAPDYEELDLAGKIRYLVDVYTPEQLAEFLISAEEAEEQ